MRALRAAVVGAILATAAWAGWRPIALEGPLNDAYPIDGGLVLVAGSGYGTLYGFDAGTLVPVLSLTNVLARNIPGVLLDDRGCLQTCAVANSPVCLASQGCTPLGAPTSIIAPVARRETSGEGWMIGATGATFNFKAQVVRADGTLGATQATLLTSTTFPRVSTGRFQGRELMAASAATGPLPFVWIVGADGGTRQVASGGTVRPFDVSFVNGGEGGLLIVSGTGAIARLADPLLGAAFVDVSAQVAPARSASLSTLLGSDAGTGFGLAVSVDGGLMGALPSRGAPGQQWISRGGPGAALARVSCLDPTLCVGVFSAGTLWLYTNDAGPSVTAPANLTEGSTGQVLATDPDGDPVLLVVEPLSPGITVDDAGTVTVAAQARCVANTTGYRVTASDGLGAHDVSQTVTLPVTAPVLQVSPPTATTDGAPVLLTGSGALACGTTWVLEDGGGTLAPAGATATFTPDVCRPDAGVANVRLEFTEPGSTLPPARAQITILPWGLPAAPTFQSPVRLRPPQTISLAPLDAGPEHACARSPGFPGTVLEWTYDAGTLQNVSFVPGPVAQLTVADQCVSGLVQVEARRRVAPAGPLSAPGVALVQVAPDLTPPGPATPFDAGFRYEATAARVAGDFTVGLTCPALFGLRASVDIAPTDGGPPRSGTFDVPGPWSLTVPGGCNGGAFTAVATLRDDAGVPLGPRDSFAVSADFVPAGVGDVVPAQVPVVCGAGATAALRVSAGPGNCEAAGFHWEQRSGPLLRSTEGDGEAFLLDTGNVELSTLVGQKVTFRISADAGDGNVQPGVERSVELSGEGLLAVSHAVSPLLLRLEEPLSFESTVSANTGCTLSGVELSLSLQGVKLVPGSVRGGAVDEGDGVTVKVGGLTVGPKPAPISWKAWVPQAGPWGVTGTARVNGAQVSAAALLERRQPPARACGCSSAPLSVSVVAAVLALLRRRRG